MLVKNLEVFVRAADLFGTHFPVTAAMAGKDGERFDGTMAY